MGASPIYQRSTYGNIIKPSMSTVTTSDQRASLMGRLGRVTCRVTFWRVGWAIRSSIAKAAQAIAYAWAIFSLIGTQVVRTVNAPNWALILLVLVHGI